MKPKYNDREVERRMKRAKELRCAFAICPTSRYNIQLFFTVSRETAIKSEELKAYLKRLEFSNIVKKLFLHELEVCERDPLNYKPLCRPYNEDDE